uniref:CSON006673 protein n=1 Tax=Culicoides sonorensis TaxID=179676 RepID=A0A336L9U3_CULSO
MESKRVILDLSEICQDYRKKAFALVKPGWQNIESLQSHIINLFGLEHYVYLTNTDGVIFPAAEHPDVITPNEVIIVHKITVEQLIEPHLAPITNGKAKKLDKTASPSLSEFIENEIINLGVKSTAKTVQNGSQLQKKHQKSSTSDSSDIEESLIPVKALEKLEKVQFQRGAPPSALQDVTPPRKRKRVRKRKTKEKKNCDPKPAYAPLKVSSKLSSQKVSEVWSKNPKNSHVRFNEAASSDSDSSDCDFDLEKPGKICKYVDSEVMPKIVHARTLLWDPVTQSYLVDAQSQSKIDEIPQGQEVSNEKQVPDIALSSITNENGKSDTLHEAEVQSDNAPSSPTPSKPTGPTTDTLEDLRKEISNLNLPIVDPKALKMSDTIAFKILRMDNQCQPTISDYIIGCIESIKPDESELTIKLLAGKDEIGSRLCTTVITEENEIGIVEEDQIDVKFDELFDPRYCITFNDFKTS